MWSRYLKITYQIATNALHIFQDFEMIVRFMEFGMDKIITITISENNDECRMPILIFSYLQNKEKRF